MQIHSYDVTCWLAYILAHFRLVYTWADLFTLDFVLVDLNIKSEEFSPRKVQ